VLDRPRTTLDSLRSRETALPTIVLTVAVAAYGAYLMYLGRNSWFWGDDWTFLFHRGTLPGEGAGLMDPFNGHWSLIMTLVYRVLYSMVGLTTYAPYLAVLVLLHLATVVALHRLLLRSGCSPWVSTATALLVLFAGVGPEMVVFDAAMNHSGSILFGYLAVLALARWGDARTGILACWVALVLALMWSGTGLAAVVMAVAYAATRWGAATGARVGSVPLLVFTGWYLGWGRHDNTADVTWEVFATTPQYVWTGLTKTLGSAVGVAEAGPVLFGALVLSLVTDRVAAATLRNLAWAGLVAATALLVLVGLTRQHMGLEAAVSGRYAYFTLVLLAPAIGLALARLARAAVEPTWLPAVAAVALLVGYAVHGINQVRIYAEGYASVSQQWQHRVQGMLASADDGQRMITSTYDDSINAGLSQDLVARPEVRPKLPEGTPAMADRLAAEEMFNVGVSSRPYDLFEPAFLDLTTGWTRNARKGPGCASYRAVTGDPLLQLATGDGNEIGVTGPATQVTTILQRDDVESPGRIWQVEAGSVHIATTAKDAVLKVSFNEPGDYIICKQ
jgi:hypothetical protein